MSTRSRRRIPSLTTTYGINGRRWILAYYSSTRQNLTDSIYGTFLRGVLVRSKTSIQWRIQDFGLGG